MKLVLIPESDVDRVLVAERPGFMELWCHGMWALQLGRVLQESVVAGVFEALAGGPKSNDDIAARCGLALSAVQLLTTVLAETSYVRRAGDRFELTDQGKRWMLGLDAGG